MAGKYDLMPSKTDEKWDLVMDFPKEKTFQNKETVYTGCQVTWTEEGTVLY